MIGMCWPQRSKWGLGVYQAYSVLSGDLSLPYSVSAR
jgi:hypothetical protein